jgi:hypothetical protein
MIKTWASICSAGFIPACEALEGDPRDGANEQADRFNLWVSHIGAAARQRWSLDHRLRDAEDISSVIIGMLKIIDTQLLSCTRIVFLTAPIHHV